jgi:hypothetical protein
MQKSVGSPSVVVSTTLVYRIALYASERAVPEYRYLNGSSVRKRWYQQLWYVINILVPL